MSNDEFVKKLFFNKEPAVGRHPQKNNEVKYQSVKQFETQTM
jgi:hypothetical protein